MEKSTGKLYTLDYTNFFWNKFRYTISSNNALVAPIYRARRTGFHRYRKFEDANNTVFFRIERDTIRSTGDNRILATLTPDGTMIETYMGNFIVTDLIRRRRSYKLLRSNGETLMHVRCPTNARRDRHTIEMNATKEDHEPFLFALTVFMDSILRRIANREGHSKENCRRSCGLFHCR